MPISSNPYKNRSTASLVRGCDEGRNFESIELLNREFGMLGVPIRIARGGYIAYITRTRKDYRANLKVEGKPSRISHMSLHRRGNSGINDVFAWHKGNQGLDHPGKLEREMRGDEELTAFVLDIFSIFA